ncbi:MAG TPA: DUF2905 family protein [Pyrinomonadaceae bacterium]|nr:DUF2905 family protein [Pyrinomonadaceae bacterium]
MSLWLLLLVAGVALGVLVLSAMRGRAGVFGRLPGDVRYSGARTKVYAPFTSMLLLSIFLSLLLSLLGWLFG